MSLSHFLMCLIFTSISVNCIDFRTHFLNLFSDCLIQIPIHVKNLEKDEISLQKLQSQFKLTPQVIQTIETLSLKAEGIDFKHLSPEFPDFLKYPFHQLKYCKCFAKFYFLNPLEIDGKQKVRHLWRNVFYSERTLTSLNRMPQYTIVISEIPPSVLIGLEIPWKFLIDRAIIPFSKAINLFTTSKFLILQEVKDYKDSSPSQPYSHQVFILCVHCTSNQYLEIGQNSKIKTLNFAIINEAWMKLSRNLQGHSIVTQSRIGSESDCVLSNINSRISAASCVLASVAKNLNFSLSNLEPSKPLTAKGTNVGMADENFYNHKLQDDWSYKAMRVKQIRFDPIHIHGRIEYFSYVVVITSTDSSEFNLQALWKCFSYEIWACLLICGALVKLFTFCIYFKLFREKNQLWYLITSLFLLVFAIVVDQSQGTFFQIKVYFGTKSKEMLRKVSPCRCVILAWLLIAFGFSNAYKSVLFSILIQPSVQQIPKNIEELVETNIDLVTNDGHLQDLITHIRAMMDMPFLDKLTEKINKFGGEDLSLIEIFTETQLNQDIKNKTISSNKFAIFNPIHTLKRFGKFIQQNFPHTAVIESPKLNTDLAKMYHWTCTRTFFHPVFQTASMALYEFGFYEKWREYLHKFEEHNDKTAYSRRYNCTSGNYNDKYKPICGYEKEISYVTIQTFEGFLILFSILCAFATPVFIFETIVSYLARSSQTFVIRNDSAVDNFCYQREFSVLPQLSDRNNSIDGYYTNNFIIP